MTVTRRDLIRLTGAGATSLLLVGTGRETASALPQDGADAQAFLAWAFAERAQASATGEGVRLDAVYDPSNGALLQFERERARYFGSAGSPLWPGRILWNHSSIAPVELTASATRAHALVRERLETRWQPAAPPAPHPTRGIRIAPTIGPDGAMSSLAQIKHEIDLVKSSTGWRIARDQHDEFWVYGKSPDLLPGSWAAERYGVKLGIPPGAAPTVAQSQTIKGPGLAVPLAAGWHSYNRPAAVQYGESWGAFPGNTGPSGYCNFDPTNSPSPTCGGDCANFVSQCLRSGGQIDAGLWYTFNGGCGYCGTTSTLAASDTWANNSRLRDFMINNGRGAATDDINSLLSGELVNYDWQRDGAWDHVAMTSVWIGGVARVCSHTPWLVDYDWHLDSNPATTYYAYTSIASNYYA